MHSTTWRPCRSGMQRTQAAHAAWPEASWMNVQTGARDVTHVEAGLAALAVRREVQRGYRTSAGSFYRDIEFATLGLHFLTRTQRKELMTRVMMRNCGMEEDSDGVESFALGSNHDTAQWTHPVTGAPLPLGGSTGVLQRVPRRFPSYHATAIFSFCASSVPRLQVRVLCTAQRKELVTRVMMRILRHGRGQDSPRAQAVPNSTGPSTTIAPFSFVQQDFAFETVCPPA